MALSFFCRLLFPGGANNNLQSGEIRLCVHLYLVYFAFAKVLAVERYQPLLVVHNRLNMHRARPQLLKIAQGIAGIVDLEIHTLVAMPQVQLADCCSCRPQHR